MKIIITETPSKTIDGYMILPVVHGAVKLDNVPRNACEEIVVDNCLDNIKDKTIISKLNDKIRKGGNLNIYGKDINILCQELLNKNITAEDFESYTVSKKTLWSTDRLCNELKNLGLKITNSQIKGYTYEVRASRSK